jgi:putative salt-induced outer membrane protein YdiY
MRFMTLFAACTVLLHADVIVMKNGDRVTGSVAKKDLTSLTVKSAQFGTVTLPWDQVDSITTDNALNAELVNGQTVQGRLTTSNGRVTIGAQTVSPGDIKFLRDAGEQAAFERLLRPGLRQLWAGTASIGWAGTGGNAQTNTFAIGMNAARATNTDRTNIYFNSVKASALLGGSKQSTAQAIRGGWGYSRNLTSKVFFNGFNDWEYDRFQALDLRAVFGGGLGYHVWKGENGRLDLLGGMAYSHSKFDPAPLPKFTRNAAEVYWGDDFNYKVASRTNFTQSYRMFNNLTQAGEYRQNFDIGATTQVTKWLTWNLAFSDRYLSNPAPGRKTNDYLYTTGFGISFSN